jgi:hypothetical protein
MASRPQVIYGTDLDAAFLWESLLMELSSYIA